MHNLVIGSYCDLIIFVLQPEEDKVDEDEDGKVEEEKEEKPKTKKVSKTTWDWKLVNDSKPIWMRK